MVPGARACVQRRGRQALLGLRGRRRRVARTLERVRPLPPPPNSSRLASFGFRRPAHPSRPSLSRRYYGWQLLQGPKAATLLEQLRLAAREQNRHAPAGLPLGFTTGGDRLFAPAPTCAGCQVAGTAPGRLLQCARCARGWHAKCVGMPTVDVAAAQGGEWVCGHCATCDGCGALAVSEIEGHWAPDAAHDLQNGWYVADGHKLLVDG